MELSIKDAVKIFRCPVNKDTLKLKEDCLISKSGLRQHSLLWKITGPTVPLRVPFLIFYGMPCHLWHWYLF